MAHRWSRSLDDTGRVLSTRKARSSLRYLSARRCPVGTHRFAIACGLPPILMPKLLGIVCHGAESTSLHESPTLRARTVDKESPGHVTVTQNDPVVVCPPQQIPAEGSDGTHRNSIRICLGRPLLIVAAREDQAYSTAPRMVVQTSIRIGIHKAVKVGVPAEGAPEIVTLQIGISLVSIDEATW